MKKRKVTLVGTIRDCYEIMGRECPHTIFNDRLKTGKHSAKVGYRGHTYTKEEQEIIRVYLSANGFKVVGFGHTEAGCQRIHYIKKEVNQ